MADDQDRYYGERKDDLGNGILAANPLHPLPADLEHDPLPTWWYVDCDHEFSIKVNGGPKTICRKCGAPIPNHQMI